MTTLIVLVSVIAAIGIGLAIWKNKELPESISAMVYDLPRKYQWIWSAWLIAVSGLLFPAITATAGGLGWLTEVCLMGAALTPLVNQDTRKWHYVLGIAAGVLSQICVLIIAPDYLFTWALFIFLMGSVFVQPEGELGKAMQHKGAFVAEVCCWLSTTLCLIFNL